MLILWNRNNKIFSYIPCALGPNFVHLILTFCSFFFIIFFLFYVFFLFSFEVQIMHTWSVCSSRTPFCLFLIQMESLCNILSKCTNFGSFCAMIKRKKKMILSN